MKTATSKFHTPCVEALKLIFLLVNAKKDSNGFPSDKVHNWFEGLAPIEITCGDSFLNNVFTYYSTTLGGLHLIFCLSIPLKDFIARAVERLINEEIFGFSSRCDRFLCNGVEACKDGSGLFN